jgi:hypothetical protein
MRRWATTGVPERGKLKAAKGERPGPPHFKGREGKMTKTLDQIADDDALLEIGRKAIEEVLLDWRESRISLSGRGNGLVVREKDGRDSHIIRLGPEDALRIGLKAIAQHLAKQSEGERKDG